MKQSTISIILPTYNRADSYLRFAMNSVLEQSFTDFELIVIDDGSTDKTRELVESFQDTRIIYHKNEKNKGEYYSTNLGASLATSTYLTWIHSDDVMPQESLKSRLRLLGSDQKLDFVHGSIQKIDSDGNIIELLDSVDWPKEKILKEYLLAPEQREKKYLIHHSTVLMKWQFYYKAGPFDCSLPYAGDIDWLIRAIREGSFLGTPDVLYLYRSHDNTRRVQDIKHGVNKEEVLKLISRRYDESA